MKVICIRCGSTNVRCTAMINPNTKEIKDLTSEAYLYGYCSDCDDPVLLSDVDEVTTRMKQEYNNFIVTNKKEPQTLFCQIVKKDTWNSENTTIKLSSLKEEEKKDTSNNEVDYHCTSLLELEKLANTSLENIIITDIFYFK